MGRILSETHLNGVQAVLLTRCVTFGKVAYGSLPPLCHV